MMISTLNFHKKTVEFPLFVKRGTLRSSHGGVRTRDNRITNTSYKYGALPAELRDLLWSSDI